MSLCVSSLVHRFGVVKVKPFGLVEMAREVYIVNRERKFGYV